MRIFEEIESEVQSYARSFPRVFNKARGEFLYDEDGVEYLDFLAGAGTLNYGHNNPIFKEKLLEYIHQAGHNREHFARHNALAVNLMSSPGAGKTALLEATADALGDEFRIAVIEGDLETENDAERIRRKGVPAVQISTGSACHLDAHMVHDALHELDVDDVDIVFIENVGNLVCPASFDLGQHFNVTLLSTPEGHDKPAKYPVMFRAADLVLVTKSDLLPVLDDFDPAYAEQCLRQLASEAPLIELSARKGDGMTAWLDWLRARLAEARAAQAAAVGG